MPRCEFGDHEKRVTRVEFTIPKGESEDPSIRASHHEEML